MGDHGNYYRCHDPLKRLARARLVDQVGRDAHVRLLYGNGLLYVTMERPSQPQTLVTDIGERLPA